MKISIVIPIYNVAPYLERCITSVLRQSFKDWEMILVDDGSKDESGAICDTFAAKDDRIRVIHQENQGLSGARNTGLKAASGEYVAFLDADDEWLLEDGLQQLMQYDGADMVVFKSVDYWNGKAYGVDDYDIEAINSLPDAQSVFSYLVKSGQFKVSACKLIESRQLLMDNELFFVPGLINEDVPWSFRLWQLCRKPVFTNLDLYGNHHRSGSITQTTDIRFYQSYDLIFSDWKEQCRNNCVNAESIGYILANLWVSCAYTYYSVGKSVRGALVELLKKHRDMLEMGQSKKVQLAKTLNRLIGIRLTAILLSTYRRNKVRINQTIVHKI